jgi:phosphoadenosine phosphosulfate reductase
MDKSIFETYAGLEAKALLEPVLRDFKGRAAVVSSFGAESAVLLHMVAAVDPSTPVIFLDTGKHFWETLHYRAKLIDRLGLTDVRSVSPDTEELATADPDGTLHKVNGDKCCHVRKTLPLQRALEGFDVVISGRKRYHGAARATLEFLSLADDRLKVEPLAGFSALDLDAYRSSAASADGDRLFLDRMRTLHRTGRQRGRPAGGSLGRNVQDGMRHSLDAQWQGHAARADWQALAGLTRKRRLHSSVGPC